MPIYGFAAGLGKLNVNSGLGEPLKAEIELLSLTPDELASLSASVAPEEAYAVQGIPRLGIHNNIKVELAKGADGSPILKLNSVQPISDPYLDMLIQVDWSSGRLLREYTILLDPPEYKQIIKDATAAPSAIINKPSTALSSGDYASQNQTATETPSTNQQAVSKSKKSKRQAAKAAEPEAVADTPSSDVSEAGQVTTQRGDSLAAIAKEVKPQGVSLDQMLVGLFEANKEAFVDGNMNRLKVGQILKVPSKDALTAVDSQQANKEVKVHTANWNAYRNTVAGNVVTADAAEQNQVKQSASGKISSAEDLAAAKKAGPQDVVKLSAGGKLAGKDAKAGAESDAKLLALQEEATAKEKALKEAQERTLALETQIADMQKLLALKNQAMASAQKSAEAQAAKAKVAEAAPQTPAPVEVKPAPVKPVEPSPVVATVPAAIPKVVPVVPEPAADKKTVATAKKPAPVVTPVPVEEELSLLESIIAGVDLMMLAAAGGVGLLAAGWAYLRNKRRRDLDSFERGILTSGGLSANTVFGNTTNNASTSDTSFLTDFAQSADGSMIDTNDVDPIAEAEVYMAYGRDAQAEEILKDAIVKEPKRYELHLKLLEMYAGRKDISAFEAIAGELYTTLGSDNPTWAKVAELGVTVEPDNPLYDLSRLPTASAESSPSDSAASSSSSNIEKELDWEKELDLDKELEFSTDFSSPAIVNPVVEATANVKADTEVITQFGGASAELEQEHSMSMPELEQGDALSNEMALFGGAETTSVPDTEALAVASFEPQAIQAVTEASQDNSLNFDFSELGNFALDSATETPVQAQVQTNASMELASALELPETMVDDMSPPSSTSPQTDEAALDFNFEGLQQAAEPVAVEASSGMSFESADFNLDTFEQPAAESTQQDTEVASFSGIDLNFDDVQSSDDNQVQEISFDLPVVEDAINIAARTDETPLAANNFDFSSISLDLSDAAPNTAALESVDAAEIADLPTEQVSELMVATEVNEDPDIDIKLDLVKVYIDMEDVEGARELLDEVIKEGGPIQRKTAEQLLSSLA